MADSSNKSLVLGAAALAAGSCLLPGKGLLRGMRKCLRLLQAQARGWQSTPPLAGRG